MSDQYAKERERLLGEFERARRMVVCTNVEHFDPMFVAATKICSECGGAACAAHLLEHGDDCPKRKPR